MKSSSRFFALITAIGLTFATALGATAQDTNELEVAVLDDTTNSVLTVYFASDGTGANPASANYEFEDASVTGLDGDTVTGNAYLYVRDARLLDNTGFELSVLIPDTDFSGAGGDPPTFPANTATITSASSVDVIAGDAPTVPGGATSGPLTATRIVLSGADGTNTEAVQTLALAIAVPAGTAPDTYTATLEVTVVDEATP